MKKRGKVAALQQEIHGNLLVKIYRGGGGGYSNIKKVGVLVVSLRVLRKNHQIFLAFKVSLRVAREEMQQLFFKFAQISLF